MAVPRRPSADGSGRRARALRRRERRVAAGRATPRPRLAAGARHARYPRRRARRHRQPSGTRRTRAARERAWYDDLRAALEAEDPTPEQEVESEAFFYGRWDDGARAHAASDPLQRNVAATGWFHEDAYDPERARSAIAGLAVPVRILLGELDVWPNARGGAELAALFPDATVTVLPGAGHFPWVDDPAAYAEAVRGIARLTRPVGSAPRWGPEAERRGLTPGRLRPLRRGSGSKVQLGPESGSSPDVRGGALGELWWSSARHQPPAQEPP